MVLLVSFLAACATPSSPGARNPEPLAIGKGLAPEAPGSSGAGSVAAEDALAIPITAADAVRGSRNAYVTIVLFTDFQCPFCARLGPTFSQLEEALGHEQLRIVLKNNPLPFHPHARFAAEVGQGVIATAGQEAFWKFHEIVFENQADMEPAQILRWAKSVGGDERAIARGVAENRWAAKIDADMELARKLGANGTPTSFINGTELLGAQPYEKFAEIVGAELEKAKSLVERGVARDKVYARLLTVNLEADEARGEGDDGSAEAAAAAKAAEAKIVWKVPVGTSPVRGSPSALVTVVVFSDFQCPFCKRVEPTIEKLRKTYGDKLRVVWKDQPLSFHPNAEPAAHLARAARAQKGDAGFWAMHDALFDAQPALEGPDLERLAKKNGLDVKKAMAQVEAKAYKRAIEDDQALAGDLGANGTPTSFVNGRKITGAQPIDVFKALVDEELARAETLVKSGVARKAIYEAAIKDGKAQKDGAAQARKSITPPTSLVVVDVVVGRGAAVKAGDKVSVHYVGTLDGGKEFDSSRTRGTPLSVEIGKGHVIKGWEQGLLGMKVGGKRKLTIPASLGYGERGPGGPRGENQRGRPPVISADATLHFDIELLAISPP